MERQHDHSTAAAEQFKAFFARYLPLFYRPETRLTFMATIVTLLTSIPRKNGWTVSEEAGLRGPQKVQRLCRTVRGDWQALRQYSLQHAKTILFEPGGILVVDETGFLKDGEDSAGVQRQYSGTAGKTENCQIGVFVAYRSKHGRCLVHQRLYMPRSWMNDRKRCRKVHVPEDVVFQTKPAMAADMLDEVRAEGLTAEWVTGDEVYGGNPDFRKRQIEAGQKFVLAIKYTERVWTRQPVMIARRLRTGRVERKPYPNGPRLRTAKETVAAFHPRRWKRLKVSEGSKGPRIYDWATKRVVHCEANEQPGYSYWLLARRSVSKPSEIAYYLCHAPVKTTLLKLAQVASSRWSVEESIKDGKQEVGLDDYQLRSWVGWHRWMQLCTLALLWLASLSRTARETTEGAGDDAEVEDDRQVALVVPELSALGLPEHVIWSTAEIRRLFLIALGLPVLGAVFRLFWVEWRLKHNLKARRSHYKRRLLSFHAGFP